MWGGVGEYGCLGTGIGCVDICEDERGRGVLGDDSVIVYYRSHGRLRADMVVSGPGSRVRVFFFLSGVSWSIWVERGRENTVLVIVRNSRAAMEFYVVLVVIAIVDSACGRALL